MWPDAGKIPLKRCAIDIDQEIKSISEKGLSQLLCKEAKDGPYVYLFTTDLDHKLKSLPVPNSNFTYPIFISFYSECWDFFNLIFILCWNIVVL